MSIPTPAPVVPDEHAWDDLVTRHAELQRRRAALDAEEVRLLAEARQLAADAEERYRGRPFGDRSIPMRALVADLAVASRLSEWTVKRGIGDAADLCDRFASAVAALEEGRISRRHVAVIQDVGASLGDDEMRADFVRRAVDIAADTTPGRLRPALEAIAARLNPESIDERHEVANERRRVWLRELPDAMGELTVVAPQVLLRAGFDRLTQFGAAVIDARGDDGEHDGPDTDGDGAAEDPDTRTMDQLRADALTDLMLTGTPDTCNAGDGVDAIRGVVQVTVPVLTAAGVGDEPCLLAGSGPIDTATARRLLGAASGWERVLTSPLTGQVLAVDRYTPGKALTRLLRARDERCRFPGCRRAVWRCDLDHTIPYSEGGCTYAGNLANLCKGHHVLKHHGAWTVRQLAGGVLEWTSPSGRRSHDLPEPMVRFVPDEELDPGPDPGGPRRHMAQWWASDPEGFVEFLARKDYGPTDF